MKGGEQKRLKWGSHGDVLRKQMETQEKREKNGRVSCCNSTPRCVWRFVEALGASPRYDCGSLFRQLENTQRGGEIKGV